MTVIRTAVQKPNKLHSCIIITHTNCQRITMKQIDWGVIRQGCYQADKGLCCGKYSSLHRDHYNKIKADAL